MLLPHDREEASKLHPLLCQVFSYWARALPKKQQERSDEQKTLKMVAGDSQDDCALSSAITRPNILLFIFFFYIKYTCFPSFHPSFALCKGGLAPCKVAERKRPIGHTIARLQSIRGYIYIYIKIKFQIKGYISNLHTCFLKVIISDLICSGVVDFFETSMHNW